LLVGVASLLYFAETSMDNKSFDVPWTLIVLIAVLFMGPALMVVTLLNLSDSLMAPTSAILLSFAAAWALCGLASSLKRRVERVRRSTSESSRATAPS
jgi:hypothetical protein